MGAHTHTARCELHAMYCGWNEFSRLLYVRMWALAHWRLSSSVGFLFSVFGIPNTCENKLYRFWLTVDKLIRNSVWFWFLCEWFLHFAHWKEKSKKEEIERKKSKSSIQVIIFVVFLSTFRSTRILESNKIEDIIDNFILARIYGQTSAISDFYRVYCFCSFYLNIICFMCVCVCVFFTCWSLNTCDCDCDWEFVLVQPQQKRNWKEKKSFTKR